MDWGAEWSYWDSGSDPGTAWTQPAPLFDDSDWSLGAGQLGYGDGDDRTYYDDDVAVPARIAVKSPEDVIEAS